MISGSLDLFTRNYHKAVLTGHGLTQLAGLYRSEIHALSDVHDKPPILLFLMNNVASDLFVLTADQSRKAEQPPTSEAAVYPATPGRFGYWSGVSVVSRPSGIRS
jgi:hypothetical protein